MKLGKRIFIVAGPSAVGKDAIINGLLKLHLSLKRMLTTTSRPRRSGDKPREYHFVSPSIFRSLITKDKLLEWVEFNGHFYGTQKRDLEAIFAANKFPIMDVDVHGVDFFKTHFPKAVSIFILPSSLSILRRRLEARGTAEKDIRSRLKTAQWEIKQAPRFDYRVINYDGKLDNVVAEVAKLIRRRMR